MEIKPFKTDYTGAYQKIDPLNPYYHLNTGLFRFPMQIEGASAVVYIPEKTSCSCWSATIVLPPGEDAGDFLIGSGWKEVADRDKVILFVAVLHEGWEDGDAGVRAIDVLRAQLDVRDHYVTQTFFAYLTGYDAGASACLRYVDEHPGAYAGVAFVGTFDVGCDGFECSTSADALTPVPAYFRASRETEALNRAIEYFRRRNRLDGGRYAQGSRSMVPANQRQLRDTVNGQLVADIIVDIDEPGRSVWCDRAAATEELWHQLHRTIRTTGVGSGGLHPFRTLDEMGVTTHEMVLDGWKRHWCEYIPKRNVSRSEERPVVVFCHGGTQVAESGLYAAEWFNVAESRDFIVLFPSGGMAQTRTSANPMPTWNISCKNDGYLDDGAFIRAMIEDLASRESIDRSRIYVTGHSMGSGMTQRCLLDMPDIFAAGASNSGVMLGDIELPSTKRGYDVACLIEIAEHDVDDWRIDSSENVKRNLEYWIDRGHLDALDDAGCYACGRYTHRVWRNRSGVPLLRYVTAWDKTHAVMPQDAWTYYDDFLCKYSRDKDGTLRYAGVPVHA